MNARLKKLLTRFNDSHSRLLELSDGINKQKLEAAPGENKWSVTQIMHHLNKAESLSLQYVSKKRLGAALLKPTGFSAGFSLLMTRVLFLLPIRFKAPEALGQMPEHVGYELIKQEWNKTRNDLARLLESLSDEELKKPIFRQPALGRLNIFQMIHFMQIHFNRHLKQINRIIKNYSKKYTFEI